jgi:hypothetical protein
MAMAWLTSAPCARTDNGTGPTAYFAYSAALGWSSTAKQMFQSPKEEWMGASQRDIPNAEGLAVAVGTIIADRPRTEPYVRFYAYGSRLG